MPTRLSAMMALTASEIAALKADADWVVLSAPNTAVPAGDRRAAVRWRAHSSMLGPALLPLARRWARCWSSHHACLHRAEKTRRMGRAEVSPVHAQADRGGTVFDASLAVGAVRIGGRGRCAEVVRVWVEANPERRAKSIPAATGNRVAVHAVFGAEPAFSAGRSQLSALSINLTPLGLNGWPRSLGIACRRQLGADLRNERRSVFSRLCAVVLHLHGRRNPHEFRLFPARSMQVLRGPRTYPARKKVDAPP
jgi:hypothetical protein